jgi:hypothetical protein
VRGEKRTHDAASAGNLPPAWAGALGELPLADGQCWSAACKVFHRSEEPRPMLQTATPALRRFWYPNGLSHSIVTGATPIDDRSCQIVQFVYRSDTEADAKAADIIAFDRQVTEEDRDILESTAWDVPLDQAGVEMNMPSDRPGVLMRRMLMGCWNGWRQRSSLPRNAGEG